jgi:hypothetical protein
MKVVRALSVAIMLASGVTACGGGSSASSPANSVTPPPPAQVQGLSTPRSVSVVTVN